LEQLNDTPQALTQVSIAYAIMFYIAAAILFIGLVLKIATYLRNPAHLRSPNGGGESPFAVSVRAATDMMFFRGTFFTDRLQWIFSVLFHFGFLFVLVRHLRYALDPNWTGPFLWRLVLLAQPVGLYAAIAMILGAVGFFARRLWIPEVRATTRPIDYFVLLLLIAVPIAGYINHLLHTDVIAVKTFFVGLATFHWQNLPTDPMLLAHLWLVALLLVTLPFSKLLHMTGVFEKTDDVTTPRAQRARRATQIFISLALLLPAAIGVEQVLQEGWTKSPTDFSKLARAHKNKDPTVMIRNHPDFLMGVRSIVVYKGVRQDMDRIEKCVDCHAVKGPDGQPVGFDSPDHFCRSCHYRAAVSIDCFECHNSKPPAKKEAAAEPFPKFAANPPRPDQGSTQR
jgi:nitrate reductase gamma subunit